MRRVITTVVPLGAIVLLILAVSAWAAPVSVVASVVACSMTVMVRP